MVLRWLAKNIGLGRLGVSFVLAIVIWGYVITTQYPEKSATLDSVAVQFNGLSSNLIVRQYSTQSVKVTINGAKDKIDFVQLSALQPIADLSICTSKQGTCDVPVKLKQVPDNVTNFSIIPDAIQIQIEEIISKELDIQVNKVGTVKLGYQQDEVKISPNVVIVSGPKSIVDRVEKAQVTVNLDDRASSLQGQVPILLLTKEGQELTDKNLKALPASVNVSASISFGLNSKTVPIRVLTVGSPAPGYIAGSSITTVPTLVTISGNPNILGPVEYVETRPIDLSGRNTDIDTTTELVAPYNAAIVGNTTVAVRIGITAAQASVPVQVTVEVLNPPAALRYQLTPASPITITLTGPYQLLQPKLPLDQIKASVDLAGLGPGTLEIPLQIQTPAGLVATNLPKMMVTIVAPPRPTSTPTQLPLPTATPTPSVGPTATASAAAGTEVAPTPTTPPANTNTPTTQAASTKAPETNNSPVPVTTPATTKPPSSGNPTPVVLTSPVPTQKRSLIIEVGALPGQVRMLSL